MILRNFIIRKHGGGVALDFLGIDVGGSAVKGALVDLKMGEFASSRIRLETPKNNSPGNISKLIQKIVKHFEHKGPVGCGFPAMVKNNIAFSAANIHPGWVGIDVASLFSQKAGNQFHIINDADAAGIAEMEYGAGRNCHRGVVLLLTLGTGIGTAIISDGHLLPNTEFGHLKIRGKDAEKRASASIKKQKGLSWKAWAKRLQEFLVEMEILISPDLIIIGGGVSKDADKFLPLLHTSAKIIPARLLNRAGIVGAALYAKQKCE